MISSRIFADTARRATVVTCQPASAGGTSCAEGIIKAFGLKAWRRPLEPAEVADLVVRYKAGADARARSPRSGAAGGVRTMLGFTPIDLSHRIRPGRDHGPRAQRYEAGIAPFLPHVELDARLDELVRGAGQLHAIDFLRETIRTLQSVPPAAVSNVESGVELHMR